MRALLLCVATSTVALVPVWSLNAQVSRTTDPDSVHFRNECRQAVQTIRTGSPRHRVKDALAMVRLCDGDGRQLLVDLVSATLADQASTDSTRRDVSSMIGGLTDARIFEASLLAAANSGLSIEARTWGMSLAFRQVQPRLLLDPTALRSIPAGRICGGPLFVSGVIVIAGNPLSSDAAARLRDSMAALVTAEGGDTQLARAAACVHLSASVAANRAGPA
jgi:hypothetical protein